METSRVAMATDTSSPVVNNLLCFISTARRTKTNDYIIQSCLPFYDNLKIREAKEILCSFSNERAVNRRGDNATIKDYQDILELFSKYEENNIDVPEFLSNSFDGMPPCSGYEVIGSTLISLMNEIINLKEEIKINKDLDTKQNILLNDINLIKDDIIDIKTNVRDVKLKFFEKSMRRISIVNECKNTDNCNDDLNITKNLSFYRKQSNISVDSLFSPLIVPETQPNYECLTPVKAPLMSKSFSPSAPPLSQKSNNTFSDVVKSYIPSHKQENNKNDVTLVKKQLTYNKNFTSKIYNRKNNKLKLLGTRKINNNSNKFSSAPRMFDLYIGNCNVDMTPDDLKEYILNETQIIVSACEELMTQRINAKSFKVTTTFEERDTLLNEDLWPEGILFRKYFKSKSGHLKH